MMEREELIQKWKIYCRKNGGLIRIRASVLKTLSIPEETRQFLMQSGVLENYFGTRMKTLSRLPEAISDEEQLPASFNRYRMTGEVGFRRYQCLDEEAEGCVVLVVRNPGTTQEIVFVNSSIQQHAECMLVWWELWQAMVRGETDSLEANWQDYVLKYERTIREIDAKALDKNSRIYREIVELKAGNIL